MVDDSLTTTPSTSEKNDDDYNPNISISTKKQNLFRFDPAMPVTMMSIFMNFALSNMALYGFTGNGRLSYLVSLATIPTTLLLCIHDAQRDYENWEKTRKYRERRFPSQILPYKVKYDWNDYEDVMIATKERRLEKERAKNELIAEQERLK